MIITRTEEWKDKKKILVILAHPDDPEFFCGAAIAHWVESGHEVNYLLLTTGQRGSQDPTMSISDIGALRKVEQNRAAEILGVNQVKFLDYLDGDLIPDLALRQRIIREIRLEKPDIVVSCDPQNLFPVMGRVNHPDHRAAGQVVVDAIFPASGNPCYHLDESISGANIPHQVEELWLSVTNQPNIALVLTDYLEKKIAAIFEHKSQIRSTESEFRDRYRSRYEVIPGSENPEYLEKFLRVSFI